MTPPANIAELIERIEPAAAAYALLECVLKIAAGAGCDQVAFANLISAEVDDAITETLAARNDWSVAKAMRETIGDIGAEVAHRTLTKIFKKAQSP